MHDERGGNVAQNVLKQNAQARSADGAATLDEVCLPELYDLSANEPRKACPARKADDEHHHHLVRTEDGGADDSDHDEGDGESGVDEKHDHRICPATVKSADYAERRADERGDKHA